MAKPLRNPLFVQQQQNLGTNVFHTPIVKRKMPDIIEIYDSDLLKFAD